MAYNIVPMEIDQYMYVLLIYGEKVRSLARKEMQLNFFLYLIFSYNTTYLV